MRIAKRSVAICVALSNSFLQRGRCGDPPGFDGIAANHLFRFIATAYETRSLVITSNWPFEQWTNFLPDATIATAILDRFLHHADVVVLSGESYRLREARDHPQRGVRAVNGVSARKRGAHKA